MSTDKCPHCGHAIALRWDREGSDRGIFECGSTIRSGEFTSSKHCQERVARQKAEEERDALKGQLEELSVNTAQVFDHVTGGKASKCNTHAHVINAVADDETNKLIAEEVKGISADLAAAKAEWSKLTDTLDLMRDEFRRIQARIGEQAGSGPTGVIRTIYDLCARALSDIPQRVPVIQQRDDAEKRVRELEVELETAISSVTAIRCTNHITVPHVNRTAHNGGECGACIAEERDAAKSEVAEATIRLGAMAQKLGESRAEPDALIAKLAEIEKERDAAKAEDELAKVRADLAKAKEDLGVARDILALRVEQLATASAKLSERKTVHEWLNSKGVPCKESTGKPMCLLRRLAVALGIQAHGIPAVKESLIPDQVVSDISTAKEDMEHLKKWEKVGKAFWHAFHVLGDDDREGLESEALLAASALLEEERAAKKELGVVSEYVLGFMFAPGGRRCVLIRKSKPQWQEGLLNGVGGKIEPGESPVEAMVREFWEETGVRTQCSEWFNYCTMNGDFGRVVVFRAFNRDAVDNARTRTAEAVVIASPGGESSGQSGISNLVWLMEMALDDNDGRPFTAEVTYPQKGGAS